VEKKKRKSGVGLREVLSIFEQCKVGNWPDSVGERGAEGYLNVGLES